MAAYNVVRFRTKPGKDEAFIKAHQDATLKAKGLRKASIVKTGENSFCFVGEWDDTASLAAARPAMVAILNTFRDTLEDLGGGLGVTDPMSGTVVVELKS